MIVFGIAVAMMTWMYLDPSAPLHAFLHPAHYTSLDIAGQVSFGVIVSVACIWLDRRLRG